MNIYRWQIIEAFDPKKDYGQRVAPRIQGILSLLKKDQTILSRDFFESNKDQIKKFLRVKTDRAAQKAVEASFAAGFKIGILQKLKGPNDDRIPFEDFCKIHNVAYWRSQLRDSNIKNLKLPSSEKLGTKGTYSYNLWDFHCWLYEKTFTFSRMLPTKENTFVVKTENITMKGVDHLLELYQEPNPNLREFVKIIKTYLLDSKKHSENSANYIGLKSNAIKSFFKENDSEINYSFNAKASYKITDSETEQRIMSLEDFMKILTLGGAKITEKAVFLCKFHRGLDTLTLVDRFNFQAFEQIAKYFKNSDHNAWDLEKCPVPVELVRAKTDYRHTGFLDRDAIESMQKYLDHRQKQTGQPMKVGEPLFLTKYNRPITRTWVHKQFNKLATNAGLQRKLKGYKHMNMYISHELRDLLKSTLIACGASQDVADHCIGHKPKDSYEKQHKLYEDYLREEFCKASAKLNLFSNISHYLKGNVPNESLSRQIEDLKMKIQTEQTEKADQNKKIVDLENTVERLVDIVSPSNSNKILYEDVDEHKKQLLLQSLQEEHPVFQLDDKRYIIGKYMPTIFRFEPKKKTRTL